MRQQWAVRAGDKLCRCYLNNHYRHLILGNAFTCASWRCHLAGDVRAAWFAHYERHPHPAVPRMPTCSAISSSSVERRWATFITGARQMAMLSHPLSRNSLLSRSAFAECYSGWTGEGACPLYRMTRLSLHGGQAVRRRWTDAVPAYHRRLWVPLIPSARQPAVPLPPADETRIASTRQTVRAVTLYLPPVYSQWLLSCYAAFQTARPRVCGEETTFIDREGGADRTRRRYYRAITCQRFTHTAQRGMAMPVQTTRRAFSHYR